MAMREGSTISQEYFDEICLENAELFGLESSEDIVKETVQQLLTSPTSFGEEIAVGKEDHLLLAHLTLTNPDSEEGRRIRSDRRSFLDLLQRLRKLAESSQPPLTPSEGGQATIGAFDEMKTIPELVDLLSKFLRNDVEEEKIMFWYLFVYEKGFNTLFTLWMKSIELEMTEVASKVLHMLIQTLEDGLPNRTKWSATVLSSFQEAVHPIMATWLHEYSRRLTSTPLESNITDHVGPMNDLILLALRSCRQCEANKRLWMQIDEMQQFRGNAQGTLAHTITFTFREFTKSACLLDTPEVFNLLVQLCRLVTTLCTFDDFRSDGSAEDGSPVVQSGHTHVQILARQGIIPCFVRLLEISPNPATLLALRAMAIQDEVVQTMVTLGVLETTSRLLKAGSSLSEPSAMFTAALGLFRNLCANDDIKTRLCTGQDSVVASTVYYMTTLPSEFMLLEHACGMFAAMALRKAKNAERLVAEGAHVAMIAAMQRHPDRAALQRQGALALRNMASRSPDLHSALLDQAPTEQVLRVVAARHLSCQDEVYAALRDLGLPVRRLEVRRDDETGEVSLQPRSTFGEGNLNFRPVYD